MYGLWVHGAMGQNNDSRSDKVKVVTAVQSRAESVLDELERYGQKRIQLRAAKQLCSSFGHSYMQAVTNGLVVCVYCSHSTVQSMATDSLMAGDNR